MRANMYTKMNNKFFVDNGVNVIYVEGTSDNMMDRSILSDNISYHEVNIGDVWSRAKLINYGLAKSKTDVVMISDVDFIYPQSFWTDILDVINNVNVDKNIIGIPVYETDNTDDTKFNMINHNSVRKKYSPYGGCYIVNKQCINEVQNFNENMTGFGFEEREMQIQMKRRGYKTCYTGLLYPLCFVLHYSHSCLMRGPVNLANKKIFR